MIKNIKWIIGTVAQLLLVIIVIPIIMKIGSIFINFETMSGKAQSIWFKLITSLPCFSTWTGLIKNYFDWSFSDNENLFNELVAKNQVIISGVALLQVFFQATIAAFVSKVFKSVHKVVSGYGAPIISTLSGIIISTIINYFLSKNQSAMKIIIYDTILLAFMIVGFTMMFKALFSSLRMRKSVFILDLIVTGLSAVITSLYLTVMVFAVNKCMGDPSQTIATCVIMTVVEIINLIVCTLLSLTYEKDKEKNTIL